MPNWKGVEKAMCNLYFHVKKEYLIFAFLHEEPFTSSEAK